MTRPELSGERLSEAKGCAEALLKDWRCYPYADVRAAETTLALLDYVAELEGLLREVEIELRRSSNMELRMMVDRVALRSTRHAAGATPLASVEEQMSWGKYKQSETKPAAELTLQALSSETLKARMKFPGNRLLLAALTEEVGELSRALLQRKNRSQIELEAIQVAAVAIRIIEEGDATFADVSDAEAKP